MSEAAMTVQASSNVLQWTGGESCTGTTTTVSGGLGYCYGCSTWPCSCHWNHNQLPFYTYHISSPDRAAILKAWLDGFMTDRRMSEKALEIVRKKLVEFV